MSCRHAALSFLSCYNKLSQCQLGLEGIVSKRAGSFYKSGKSRNWLKTINPNFVRRDRHAPRPLAHPGAHVLVDQHESGDRIQVKAGVLYALINHRQDDYDASTDARDALTRGTGHLPF